MKRLKSWKFLFGLATAITVGLASTLLFQVNSDRNKLKVITSKLIQSVEVTQSNNQNMQMVVDSLADRLCQTDSNIEILEAQKDSLIKGIPMTGIKSRENQNAASLAKLSNEEKPVFSVTTNDGRIIDTKKGIGVNALIAIRVSAGPGFRIRRMETILSRGSAKVATINSTSGSPDISAWRSQFRFGDQITIIIKRVGKITPSGVLEEFDLENEVIVIPVH